MKMHVLFCLGFYDHLRATIKERDYSHHQCREHLYFDAGRMVTKGGSINTSVYFKYCIALGKCPVQFMIRLLKPHINAEHLIDYIRTEFNTAY